MTRKKRKKKQNDDTNNNIPSSTEENVLAHFFLDVDMRRGHEGLREILKKHKIDINANEFVVFMNTARTIIKMFCKGNEVLMHYKKDGRLLDPGIIPYLPTYCGGNAIKVDDAIEAHLLDLMQKGIKRKF